MKPFFEKKTVEKAMKELKSGNMDDRESATRELRFLGTHPAIDQFVFLLAEDSNIGVEAALGLMGSRDWEYAKERLVAGLTNPDVVVNDSYLNILASLSIPKEMYSGPSYPIHLLNFESFSEIVKLFELDKIVQPTITMPDTMNEFAKNKDMYLNLLAERGLKQKRGIALAEAAALITFKKKDYSRGCKELALSFNNLSERTKSDMFRTLDSFHCPEMKRLLFEIIQKPRGSVPGAEWWDEETIMIWLMKYAKAEAREIIMNDIKRTEHRYHIGVLTLLPEKSLPRLDKILLENFKISRFNDSWHDTSANLIERYASPKILPDVIQCYKEKEGQWHCAVQNSFLRYWIRNDRKNGLEAYKKAMNNTNLGCYTDLCRDVLASIYADDVEDLAFGYLNNQNKNIQYQSLDLLQQKGSVRSVEILLKKLEELSIDSESKKKITVRENQGFCRHVIEFLAGEQKWKLTLSQKKRLENCLLSDEEKEIYRNARKKHKMAQTK